MDRKIEKRRWRPARIVSVVAAAIAIAAAIFSFFRNVQGSRLRVDSERLTISPVERGEFREFIPVTGEVVPIRTVFLDAAEGGRVETVYVEDGRSVKESDKLLKLVNTNLLLDIMYREAELFQQSNNLRNTELALEQNRLTMRDQILEIELEIRKKKRKFERLEVLSREGLISREDYEEARDDYEFYRQKLELTLDAQKQETNYRENQVGQLTASLERMEANLQVAKKNLEDLVIKAPVSGYLTSLNAEIGESKVRGETLGKIDVLDGFKLRLMVDEHYIPRLEKGQVGVFGYSDQEFELEIQKISSEVLDNKCEVEMEFMGAEPGGIRRGQTLHGRLQLSDLSEGILLEKGGFFQDTGGRWVFVVTPSGGAAVRRQIRLGLENPHHFQVLEGLVPGERVITSSYSAFGDVERLVFN